MEEVLAGHQDVAECAVHRRRRPAQGRAAAGPRGAQGRRRPPAAEIAAELVGRCASEIGPVAAFKLAPVVKRLPKTRSGKILRGTMKKIADGTPYQVPATIDDPVILDEIGDALRELGYARR